MFGPSFGAGKGLPHPSLSCTNFFFSAAQLGQDVGLLLKDVEGLQKGLIFLKRQQGTYRRAVFDQK